MNVDLVFESAASNWSGVLSAKGARGLDETRFTELVNRQSRFVFRLAYALLRNAGDAEDVVQETFLKLFKNGSWQNIQDERAFLARAAWRVATGRKRAHRTALPDLSVNPTPEAIAIGDERTRQIHVLIDSLPERLRDPLTLSALHDITTAEIAAILDQPEGTVRRCINEARTLLKQKLERMDRHVR